MTNPPIFFLTGPPAAGKTSLSIALMQRYSFGLHIPVDDLREWVVSGLATPVGWNDETTRQFTLAEESACDLAIRYNDAGFAIAIDHCQGPPTLDKLIESRLATRNVIKIAVAPTLEINHRRNIERTTKDFDHTILTKTIDHLNSLYRNEPIHEQGWLVFDNTQETVEQSVDRLLDLLRNRPR